MEYPDPDNISHAMSFLKEFNYPLIHTMNHEEIANVFHISNRCFLVCWALKHLNEECYLEVLRDREHDKHLLANLVSQHGFCTEKDKIGFFNGDLSVAKQVQILLRMFNFIKRLKIGTIIDSRTPVTLENLHSLINTNLNIFPTLGEIKTLSEKEEEIEINKLQKEIEELQVTTENNLLNEHTNEETVCQINKKKLRSSIDKLSENFYQFERIVKAITKEKNCEVTSNYKADPRSEELLLRSSKYLDVVSEYIENLRNINTFMITDLQEANDEISPLIEILAGHIHTRL